MTTTGNSAQMIDAYLGKLRARLRGMRQENASEILEELRSHIVERAATGGDVTSMAVESALAALGSPEDLASMYMTDDLLARAEVSRTPWTILRGVFHWATLSVRGFLVLIVSTTGYLFGAAFFVAALAKPFNPKVGLWLNGDNYTLALGMTDARMQGHELLGWFLIPIGLSLGGGTILLTTHFALRSIRKFRRARSRLEFGRDPQ